MADEPQMDAVERDQDQEPQISQISQMGASRREIDAMEEKLGRLTSRAVLDYQMGGDWHRQRLGTLIVNRASIDHIIEAVGHDSPDRGDWPSDEPGLVASDFAGAILTGPTPYS